MIFYLSNNPSSVLTTIKLKSGFLSKGNQTFTVQASELGAALTLKTPFYDIKGNRTHHFTFSLDCKMPLLCFHDSRTISY